MKNILKKIAFLLFIITTYPGILGAKIPWTQKSSFQYAQDIQLSELIRAYSALQGLTVVIDKDITGTVNGRFEDLSPEEFLNRLSRANGLIWFYDGNVIYVYQAQKATSTFLEINDFAAQRLLETISSLGMVSPNSSIRMIEPGGIAFVSGPPKYVEIVSDIANRLSKNLEISYSEVPKIKIFPLKYAWAYDTTFTSQETKVTVPGVATILRGLMDITHGFTSEEVVVSGQRETERIPVTPKVRTFKQVNDLELQQNQQINVETVREVEADKAEPLPITGITLIQPDIRLNAIIVRDVEARLPQYEEIIKTLDVPVQIIEISAALLDINRNYSQAIGNQFFSVSKKGETKFAINPTSSANGVTPLLSGFNIQTALTWDGYKILSQIQALATDGKAQIIARPTVLTLNNIEAEIARTETFYVALRGNNSSDLASVTVGTTLKVTPRVIQEGAIKKIQLLVSIEDGTISTSDSVTTEGSKLPNTANNVINTQAVMIEGQSLFIGGYYRQSYEFDDTGVPYLKCIPVLGYLFKNKTKKRDVKERMYLITPRVIDLNYEGSLDVDGALCELCPPPQGTAHEISQSNFQLKYDNLDSYEKNRVDIERSPYVTGYQLCQEKDKKKIQLKYDNLDSYEKNRVDIERSPCVTGYQLCQEKDKKKKKVFNNHYE